MLQHLGDASLGTGNGSPLNQSLENLLPKSLYTVPALSIKMYEHVGEAAYLLSHFLESYTDSLVVTRSDEPIGFVGGLELMKGVMNNPTSNFFDDGRVYQIMNKDISVITKQTKLSDLLKKWAQTRRAFSIMKNPYYSYSVISARKLLEIGTSCDTGAKLSDISRKKVFTFTKDHTIREIIKSMFENKTRKLMLEGTSEFISDRIIIRKITRELNCLHGVTNFLEMKADLFQLAKAKEVSDKLTLRKACQILYEMESPYLLLKDGVMTPWDIITSFSSENL